LERNNSAQILIIEFNEKDNKKPMDFYWCLNGQSSLRCAG